MEAHIGQHISQATEMQTLRWSKTRPSFSGGVEDVEDGSGVEDDLHF